MRATIISLALLLITALAPPQPWTGPEASAEEGSGKGLLELLGPGIQLIKPFISIGFEEEKALGGAIAIEVFSRFGGEYRDPDLQRYVTLVGTAVARRSSRPEVPYRFAILNSDELNAFSAPGGYVFVTIGLLSRLKSEAELAGVLGHEIAHISQKHILKTIEEKRKYQGIGQITMTLLNQDPAVFNELIDGVMETLFSSGLEKDTEYEADALGTEYIARVGYDPTGLRDFLTTLHNIEGNTRSIFYRTHPSTSDRINRLNSFIRGRYGSSSSRSALAERYYQQTLRPLGIKPSRSASTREAAVDRRALEAGYKSLVEKSYKIILNRDPDPTGYSTHVNALVSGTMTAEEFIRALLESPEFKSRNVPNDEYVKILYRAILGREPDPDGFSFYYSRLNNGGMSREEAREKILSSDEYRRLQN